MLLTKRERISQATTKVGIGTTPGQKLIHAEFIDGICMIVMHITYFYMKVQRVKLQICILTLPSLLPPVLHANYKKRSTQCQESVSKKCA